MPWQPSRDASVAKVQTTSFWDALKPIFEIVFNETAPIGRHESASFDAHYVRARKGDDLRDAEALASRLPPVFKHFDLGSTEIELLDFLFHDGRPRVLAMIGPRGAGKTTLIRFVENVLQRASTPPQHLMLILDCLELAKTSGDRDFLGLLCRELESASERTPGPGSGLLRRAASQLASAPDLDTLRTTARDLAKGLRAVDGPEITIVFDNTDQLPPHVARISTSLARQIWASSKIGSIRCIRPASLLTTLREGGARAFFTGFIQVNAPSVTAWLTSLGPRLETAADHHWKEVGRSAIAYHTELTTAHIRTVGHNLAELINRERRRQDSALQILQAASADDVRQLIRLLCRLLSHRSLPGEWLLGLVKDFPTFHPLVALVEGQRSHYIGEQPDVPNLLHYSPAGHSEFLLPFLILRFLDGDRIGYSHVLLDLLSECGYERTIVEGCLIILQQALLIDGDDRVTIEKDAPLPTRLMLTEAGQYYLYHLISFTDYLSAVVCDVPLEHEAMKAAPDSDAFALRLASLIEYASAVREAEVALLRRLQNATPSGNLRSIADRLRNRGMLTAAVIAGIRVAIERGKASQSKLVRDRLDNAVDAVTALERWQEIANQQLNDIANRGRKTGRSSAPKVRIDEPGIEIEAIAQDEGDNRCLDVTVRLDQPASCVVVAASSTDGTFRQAGVAITADHRAGSPLPAHSIALRLPPILGGALENTTLDRFAILDLTKLERAGVLVVDEQADQVDIRLYLLREHSVREFTLGTSRSLSTLRSVSRDAIASVSRAVLTGRDPSEDVHAAGVRLADAAFNRGGGNIVSSLYEMIDSLVLVTTALDVAWEWITPEAEEGKVPISLGERWRTNRWHSDRVKGAARYLLARRQGPASPMVTVGCDAANGNDEHLPTTVAELVERTRDAATVHLVGHQGERGVLLGSALELTADKIRTAGLYGVRNVIMSSCGTAAESVRHNLAATIAEVCGCIVWAPMVEVRASSIAQIDQQLRDFIRQSPSRSVDTFVYEHRKHLPVLRLYVRYGVCAGDRANTGI